MSLPQNNNKINSLNKLNIPAKFDSDTVSNVPAFTYLEAAKSCIDFKSLISDNISYQKAANAIYQPTDIIDFMVDASILGYSRFSHYENLREDAGYLQIKDFNVPSEKVCRDLLKAMPEESVNELRELNKNLLSTIAKTQPAKEVILDFDDTVCTVFGNQEGSANGYNPRYKGRPSFKEKVGIISKTDELLNLTLEEGTHHSNHEFLSFLESCIETLPKTWYLKRIRADRGFFDQKNFRYCEDNGIEYVIKAKMQNGVKKIIDYVNENPDQYPWVKIDNTFSVTEIRVPLKSWDRERRFVLIKKSLPKSNKNGQLLFEEFTYEYQAIVTNVDYLTAEEVFNDYNQRCNIENKIDELKEGFAFDQNTQINRKCNELYLLIKMIAFNLNNWFKRTFLPESMHQHEIKTIRRIFYKIAGNICGSGWYKHIRFAPNKLLKKTITHLRKALTDFRKKVVLN
ncbi:IS1380 family transposase [Halanaerobium congolense]|uniref:IS1380 family transposase n=2 Tax=Halanaerobium congolense TaxID=54121 RepID=UPI0008868EB8|nr:IS1380 family transposase [Halanaerobium congolense]SDK81125.1 Transposase DDE domain group 1 [Halanaerobium congolense]